jgi:hypothetical protein
MLPHVPTGGYMWIAMYLLFDDTGSEVQDGGYPAGEAPKLLLAVPGAACGLDDRLQGLLVRPGLDVDQLGIASPDRLAADKQFHSCVPYLALRVGSVSNTDK